MSDSANSADTHQHDDHRLREFVRARARGDQDAAQRWWGELVVANFDRVQGFVQLHRGEQLFSDEEVQEALQRSFERLLRDMVHTFHGSSIGEWSNATRRLVQFACLDVQRIAATRSRREIAIGPHGGNGTDDDAGRQDRLAYEHIERLRKQREADEMHDEAMLDERGFLDYAIPLLPRQPRAVIELDRAGVSTDEIQRRLDMTAATVYTNRKRGLTKLQTLRPGYRP